jgi:uncharacterized OB-fold protein
MPPVRARPVISKDTEFFWHGLQRGELLVQACARCGALQHPPGPSCGQCLSLEMTSVRMRGTGVIYSYVIHHTPAIPGFDEPHIVVLVELDEGPRMIANLLDAAPEDVRIGAGVVVDFQRLDDVVLAQFRLQPT